MKVLFFFFFTLINKTHQHAMLAHSHAVLPQRKKLCFSITRAKPQALQPYDVA